MTSQNEIFDITNSLVGFPRKKLSNKLILANA